MSVSCGKNVHDLSSCEIRFFRLTAALYLQPNCFPLCYEYDTIHNAIHSAKDVLISREHEVLIFTPLISVPGTFFRDRRRRIIRPPPRTTTAYKLTTVTNIPGVSQVGSHFSRVGSSQGDPNRPVRFESYLTQPEGRIMTRENPCKYLAARVGLVINQKTGLI